MRKLRPPPIWRSPSPRATPHVILATEVRASVRCHLILYYPGVRSHQSQESVTETEPPAYSDLYSRDNSQLDRLVVSE